MFALVERQELTFFCASSESQHLKFQIENCQLIQTIYSVTDGLYGRAVDCVEKIDEAGAPVGFVRPWPLEDYLEAEVPRRLQAAAVTISAFQVPDALINSRERDKPWLARFALPPGPPTPPLPEPRPRMPSPTRGLSVLPHLEPEVTFFGRRIAAFSDQVNTEIARSAEVVVAKEAKEQATPFGPPHGDQMWF